MKLDSCFKLGLINKAHGLKGEIRATMAEDFPIDYNELESIYLLVGGKLVPFFVERISVDRKKAYIKFEDVDDLKSTESLLDLEMYLPFEAMPGSEDGLLYYGELIGYTVQDHTLGTLGKIREIMSLPAQEILVMEYKNKDILIPASEELIIKIERRKKVVHLEIPEGLLEIYLNA